jgi:type I restriction enzyme, S subunit
MSEVNMPRCVDDDGLTRSPRSGWRVQRLKFALRALEQGWSPSCENRPAEEGEWGVLKVGCVNGAEFDPMENKALPADLQPIPSLEIRSGDILMSRANTRELLGSAALVRDTPPRLLLCDKLYRLTIDPAVVDASFLVWALGSRFARDQLERDATGASSSMQNIAQSVVRELLLPMPDLEEQRAIADYLDEKTATIDALIAKRERHIELLEEHSRRVLHCTVTRGVTEGVAMRETGMPWLAEIPHHWELRRLKYIADFVNGAVFKPSEWAGEGVPIIRIQNLNGGDDFNYSAERVPEKYHVQKGDLLFGWSGNRGTSFGPFIWHREGLHYLNQHIFRVTDFDVHEKWLYWVLKEVTDEIEQRAHGIIGMVHVTRPELDNTVVPVPPIPEQQAIAASLDRAFETKRALVRKESAMIQKLREYRQTLISAVVTGQIPVGEEVPV